MIESVRYVAYHAPTAPAGKQWLGQVFILPVPTEKVPNPRETPWNVFVWGTTREEVLRRAEEFWLQERARVRGRKANIDARTEKAKATRTAKTQQEEPA